MSTISADQKREFIRTHILAAALQYRLLKLREEDGADLARHIYVIDPNVISLSLNPKERAKSTSETRLGVGDVYPNDGTGYVNVSAAPIAASIARHLFEHLSSLNPLIILKPFELGITKLIETKINAAKKGLEETVRNRHSNELTSFVDTLKKTGLSKKNGTAAEKVWDAINQILFLKKTEYEEFRQLKLLIDERRFCTMNGLSSDGTKRESHVKRALEAVNAWEAQPELKQGKKIFEQAFDQVVPQLDIPPEEITKKHLDIEIRRKQKRGILAKVLSQIAYLNRRREDFDLDGKLIFVSLDNRALSLCQYVSVDGTAFSKNGFDNSFMTHYVRHPRCFLNDQGVLPEWEQSIENKSLSKYLRLDIEQMYATLLSGFFVKKQPVQVSFTDTEPLEPGHRFNGFQHFSVGEGQIDLTPNQVVQLDQHIESSLDVIYGEVREFAEALRETLARGAELPSEDTLTKLITELTDGEKTTILGSTKLSEKNADQIVSEINKLKPDLKKAYDDGWRMLMVESFDTSFFLRDLTNLSRSSRTIANLCHTGADSIAEFISFTETILLSRSTYDAQKLSHSDILKKYISLTQCLKNEDPSYYSLALSHSYANATVGDWKSCIAACRFAIASIPSENREQKRLDVRQPNGREAYYYLCYAFRHSASNKRHFENCESLLSAAESIYAAEKLGASESFDIVPERFKLERVSLSISELLLARYVNKDIYQSDTAIEFNAHQIILDQFDLIAQIDENVEKLTSSPEDVKLVREKCLFRSLTNILALSLEFHGLYHHGQEVWPRFKEIGKRTKRKSYFTDLIGYIGRASFDNEPIEGELLTSLRNSWAEQPDRYVFQYDKSRYLKLLDALPKEDIKKIVDYQSNNSER